MSLHGVQTVQHNPNSCNAVAMCEAIVTKLRPLVHPKLGKFGNPRSSSSISSQSRAPLHLVKLCSFTYLHRNL